MLSGRLLIISLRPLWLCVWSEALGLSGSQSLSKMRGSAPQVLLKILLLTEKSLYYRCPKRTAWGTRLLSYSTHLPADLGLDWDTPCLGRALSFAHFVPKTPLLS